MSSEKSSEADMVNVLITLAHELGCALEMSYDPAEMRELWGDGLDGLKRTKEILEGRGLAVPPVVDNVLKIAAGNGVG